MHTNSWACITKKIANYSWGENVVSFRCSWSKPFSSFCRLFRKGWLKKDYETRKHEYVKKKKKRRKEKDFTKTCVVDRMIQVRTKEKEQMIFTWAQVEHVEATTASLEERAASTIAMQFSRWRAGFQDDIMSDSRSTPAAHPIPCSSEEKKKTKVKRKEKLWSELSTN